MTMNEGAALVIDPHAISCQAIVALVTSYFDGVLSETGRIQFDAHVDDCEGCRRHLEQVRLTATATGRLREEDLPAELRQRLLTAFQTWKQDLQVRP